MSNITNENIEMPLDINKKMDNNLMDKNKNEKIEIKTGRANTKFIIIIIISCTLLLNFALLMNNFLNIPILISIIIIDLLCIVLTLYCKTKKVVFIKNEEYNLLNIKKINFFSHQTNQLNININDIFIDVIPSFYETKKKEIKINSYSIVIINKLINEKDIEINSGNIINTPVKFYYLFEEIDEKEKYIDIKNKLCEFINSPPEFENPLFFNIDIYMGKAMDNKLPLIFGNYLFSRYMKINEKVFIYNIPLSKGIIPVIIFLGFYINVNFIGGIVLCFLSEKSILIKIIILILISIIIDLLFFYMLL